MDEGQEFLEVVGQLVKRLERERSEQAATALARRLGYIVQREEEVIWVDHPASPWFSLYFRVSDFVEDVLASGRKVVAACGGSCL